MSARAGKGHGYDESRRVMFLQRISIYIVLGFSRWGQAWHGAPNRLKPQPPGITSLIAESPCAPTRYPARPAHNVEETQGRYDHLRFWR